MEGGAHPDGQVTRRLGMPGAVKKSWVRRVRETSGGGAMIRRLATGEYRLYSRKKDPRTGRRRNLGTFKTLAEAKRHERAIQFFKRR